VIPERFRKNKVKKTFRLNQALLDRARKALGARTETEAIEMALDDIVFGDELDRVLGKYGGRVAIRRPF
jgi:hypothetical protein